MLVKNFHTKVYLRSNKSDKSGTESQKLYFNFIVMGWECNLNI